jgi:hypothetical protein
MTTEKKLQLLALLTELERSTVNNTIKRLARSLFQKLARDISEQRYTTMGTP